MSAQQNIYLRTLKSINMAASRALFSCLSKVVSRAFNPRLLSPLTETVNAPIFESVTLISVRNYKGSNRYKRNKARKDKLKLEKELERKYGITNRSPFDTKAWFKENYFVEIDSFQERLNIIFNDEKVLVSAFAHSSFVAEEEGTDVQNLTEEEAADQDLVNRQQIRSRLSDLPSDKLAVIGYNSTLAIIKEELYKRYPNMTSTICNNITEFLTNRNTINMLAKNLAIDELTLMSKELEKSKINEEYQLEFSLEDIISDTFFAVVGAIEKDLGLEPTKCFVNDFITTLIDYEDMTSHVELEDPHEELMKILSLHGVDGVTRARILAETGVDTHFPFFYIGIYCNGLKLGEGSGHSARSARMDAFKNSVFSCMEGDVDFQALKRKIRTL